MGLVYCGKIQSLLTMSAASLECGKKLIVCDSFSIKYHSWNVRHHNWWAMIFRLGIHPFIFCTTMNQLVGAAVSPLLYILHYGCSLVARSFENITSPLANTSLPNFFLIFPLVPRYTYSFPGICVDALKIIKTSWVMVVLYRAVCGSKFSPQFSQCRQIKFSE